MPRWERLVASVDFERALQQPGVARTPHFAMHHLDRPSPGKLSTKMGRTGSQSVDKPLPAVDEPQQWLGAVVPKRHAKRAVTRSLVKRQIRAAAARAAGSVGHGVWVVRQRAPFDRATYPSARSAALTRALRSELDALFASAAERRAA